MPNVVRTKAQIKTTTIARSDVEKTAFACHLGLFESVRLPFGLCNSPATFQRLMDIVLGDAKFNYAMAYMDDVVVFSENLENHLIHLTTVLQSMRDAAVTINPRKVHLVSSSIKLLSLILEHGTVRPDEEKLQAIPQVPSPTDVKGLQRFLGMVASTVTSSGTAPT